PGRVDAGHLVVDRRLQAGFHLTGVGGRQFTGQRQRPAGGEFEERLAGLLAGRAVYRDHRRGQRWQEHHIRRWHAARGWRSVAEVLVVQGHRVLGRRAEVPGRVTVVVVAERG